MAKIIEFIQLKANKWLNYWVFKASAWLLPRFSACIFRPKTAAEAKRRGLRLASAAVFSLYFQVKNRGRSQAGAFKNPIIWPILAINWVFKASAWLLPWFSACIFRPKTAAEAKRRPLKPYYLAYIGLIIEFIQLIGLYWPNNWIYSINLPILA